MKLTINLNNREITAIDNVISYRARGGELMTRSDFMKELLFEFIVKNGDFFAREDRKFEVELDERFHTLPDEIVEGYIENGNFTPAEVGNA